MLNQAPSQLKGFPGVCGAFLEIASQGPRMMPFVFEHAALQCGFGFPDPHHFVAHSKRIDRRSPGFSFTPVDMYGDGGRQLKCDTSDANEAIVLQHYNCLPAATIDNS